MNRSAESIENSPKAVKKSQDRRILVFGARGQVGECLRSEVLADSDWNAERWTFLAREEADVSEPTSWTAALDRIKPQIIINAAAYTQVDRAETDTELCEKINARFPSDLAKICQTRRIFLIHYSTDYVYAGSGTDAHLESEPLAPVNTYGKSKAAGDEGILASGCRGLIFRTSWVYSEYGKNFVKTILKLAQEKPELKIVNDQVGGPTYARDLARVTLATLKKLPDLLPHLDPSRAEVVHFANRGWTQWFEFAQKALELFEKFSGKTGSAHLIPIPTSEYPTPAKRPLNSRLDLSKIKAVLNESPRSWEVALEECIQKLNA